MSQHKAPFTLRIARLAKLAVWLFKTGRNLSNIDGNTSPSPDDIVKAVCDRMDSSSSSMHVSVIATPSNPSGTAQAGDTAVIKVVKPLQTITGFYAGLLHGKNLTSHRQGHVMQHRRPGREGWAAMLATGAGG